MRRERRRPSTRQSPLPMPLATSNLAPSAASAVVEIASTRLAVPSPPNWPKFCKARRAALRGTARAVPYDFHTCEHRSHRPSIYSFYFQESANGTGRALRHIMKYVWLGCWLFGGLLFGGTQDSEFNVNTRYTVEDVVVSGDGWRADLGSGSGGDERISSVLRKDIAALIGEKLNPTILDDLARRLRKELHARTVEQRVLRGKSPDYVQVVFEVHLRPTRFDVSVPKFLYSGKQGWSGAVEGTATVRQNGFTLGLASDGDELIERY